MVVTGLRRAEEAGLVVGEVVKRMKGAKIAVANPVITVQNIVASGDLHTRIDLDMAAVVMESAMFEPEVFPGMIYRMADPKAVFLIFSNGKIVCTGAKTKEDVARAIQKLTEEVADYGVATGEEFNDKIIF
jgi:transcription initiation factor TFIID TATA-box-binding protein